VTDHPHNHYETPAQAVARKSAYGVIKERQLTNHLPEAEQEEYYRLDRIKARFRTPAEQARLEELLDKAEELHVPPRRDPLFDYAEEVAARMRARD